MIALRQSPQLYLAVALGMAALLVGAFFFNRPVAVTRVSSLEAQLGNRIKLRGTFDGFHKSGEAIVFDGATVLMETHATGQFDWPKTGDKILVVGRLERPDSQLAPGVAYIVRDAS